MEINRHSPVPPYQQVADDMRQRIVSGDLPAGSRLPAYSTLADQYGVGVGTLTRAMALLRVEGLVETGTGGPSYVRDKIRRRQVAVRRGARWIARMPTRAEREQHGIEMGVPVVEVTEVDGRMTVYPADRWRFVAS